MQPSRIVAAVFTTAVVTLAASPFTASHATPATATQPAAPQLPLAPDQAITQLDITVTQLVNQRVLNQGQGQSLTTKLGQATSALAAANPDAVLSSLRAFDNEVGALVAARVIEFKDATVLQVWTDQAIAGVSAVRDIPVALPMTPPCYQTGPCEEIVLHVDDTAAAGGDGSEDSPFRTLNAALAAAAKAQACGVRIVAHPGTYYESMTLTRPTRIEGTVDRPVIVGTVFNPAGHELAVTRVTFAGSPAPGAIVVDGPCGSSTEVSNVVIRGAQHHGVLQRRGSLRVIGTEIRGTVPDAGDVATGRAIRLLDGAQAVIAFADLSSNTGGALLASGEDTRVYLALSNVDSNGIHPALAGTPQRSGIGAVEVSDGALLLSEFTSLSDNRGNGLSVGGGARAHFRYGPIERSRSVEVDGEAGFTGINAMAFDGGTLHLSNFRANHGEFVGLAVLGAYARGSAGTLGYNTIGMAGLELPADFDVNRLFACVADVAFLHNDRPFSGDTLPAPCDEEVPGSCPACTVNVPFACTWCG